MNIAIVTDSTADIPEELCNQYSISVIPAILIINGNSFLDGRDISRDKFYKKLPGMNKPPTTATPSVGTFKEIYEHLFMEGFEKIISIHIASSLSGIFNTAQLVAKEFNGKVIVIDSGQLSLGLGFQVLMASEFAKNGASLNRILNSLAEISKRVRVVAMLDTLEYVRRSGRVSWARASLGTILKIKPFFEVKEGQVYSLGQVRTRQKGFEYLIELFNNTGRITKFGILHTNAEKEALKFCEILNISLPEPPFIVNVTTVVGTHVGPNGLGFAAVIEDS